MNHILLALLTASPGAHAQDCAAEQLAEYAAQVEERGDPQAYRCLISIDEAGAFLLARIQNTTDATPDTGLTRALAVHWMPRLDEPLSPDVARALNPSDQRLLSDAIRARRGRQSPSPEHDKVFQQFDWYTPDASYTDKRLTPTDRVNLQTLANPPEPPKPDPEASAAEAIAQAAATPATERGCSSGCAAAPSRPAALLLLPLALLLSRRRHR